VTTGPALPAGPVAALTLVRYAPRAAALGAMHMATQRRLLAREPGLRFARLLGTGAGIGFSAAPDLTAWGLFGVWDSAADWERFRAESPVAAQYRRRGCETFSLLLSPLSSHGRWGGVDPFAADGAPPPSAPAPPPTASGPPSHGAAPLSGDAAASPAAPAPGEPVAVLTRASIRMRAAGRFWGRVGAVDATLRDHPDLLLSFGVGEAPWVLQGTVSVWRSTAAMRAWAYATPAHAEVVRRTRDEGWYAEELFARFRPVATAGTWNGRVRLDGVVPHLPG
jgi:heme-degrading monooxygenase HmoA